MNFKSITNNVHILIISDKATSLFDLLKNDNRIVIEKNRIKPKIKWEHSIKNRTLQTLNTLIA